MKRVLLLLSDGFEAYEAAVFTDVLGWADLLGLERIELLSVGLRPRLRCTFGFAVTANATLDEVNQADFDALAIPGGFARAGFYQDAYDPKFLGVIRGFHQKAKPIAAVCVGALALAKSGILVGRHATTYQLDGGKFLRQLAETGACVVHQPIVVDDNLITSSSPGTAVDVAFTLLERLTSRDNADRVRHLMGFRICPTPPGLRTPP
jgi:4-methyl-5(b-hydroxyethyl)-thiazole monophosphate biosynthesis